MSTSASETAPAPAPEVAVAPLDSTSAEAAGATLTPITLLVTFPGGKKEVREFNQPRIVVGRARVDLDLSDPHASGRHGEIVHEAEGPVYRDLGSANGTWTAAGTRITSPIPLTPGTRLMIGESVIEVRLVGERAAPTQLFELPTMSVVAGERLAAGGAEGKSSGAKATGAPMPSKSATGPETPEFHERLAKALKADAGATVHLAEPRPRSLPVVPGAVAVLKEAIGEIVPTFKGGLGERGFAGILADLKDAARLVKEQWLQAGLVFASLLVPVAVVAWLGTIVPLVGIVGTVLSIASSLLGILGFAALVLLMAEARRGQRVTALAAWKAVFGKPIENWLSLFVSGLVAGVGAIALIVPGLALGVFSTAAFALEGHRFADANRRSLESWRRGRLATLVAVLLIAVASSVILVPLGIVGGLIPVVGPLITGVVGAAVSALSTSVLAAYVVQRF